MSTVLWPSCPTATAMLKAMVVLPTPPLGAKTVTIRADPSGLAGGGRLAHLLDARHQLVAGERHREHGMDPRSRVGCDGLLGHGQHDHRNLRAGRVDLLNEGEALELALEERVDQHDVRAELGDDARHAAAVAHDVQQLDRGLRVQQPADVLRDLGDILDDEEADLVRHRADSTTRVGPWTGSLMVPSGSPGRVLRAVGR